MFLFSKKLVYLVVVVAVVFGGERRAAEGLDCWDQAKGDSVTCAGTDGDVACEAKIVGGKITKGCNENVADWKTGDGTPKMVDGSECYCITPNNCNEAKNYCNLKEDGSGGGGNGTGGGGSGAGSGGDVGDSLTSGAVGAIISPVLAVLFCFLTSAARAQ